MKYRFFSVFLLCILLISFSVYAINFTPEETYNSVVVVYTDTGVGSGFSVKENTILTNAHVVGYNKTVTVNLYDGTTIRGTVIKTDIEKDLALIDIDKEIVPLTINTESVSVGQEVYAIGAPKDMPYTMTKGIVSALDRNLGQNSYIQIDASVNSGNSGGPLVDENGTVIGIITLKASDAEGIGFALNTKNINDFINNVEVTEQPFSERKDNPSDEGLKGEEYEMYKRLMTENDGLKIVVCISVVLNIVLCLLYIHLLLRKNSKKEKDEFDFEIEIEE